MILFATSSQITVKPRRCSERVKLQKKDFQAKFFEGLFFASKDLIAKCVLIENVKFIASSV
jgi:hypothetical protein